MLDTRRGFVNIRARIFGGGGPLDALRPCCVPRDWLYTKKKPFETRSKSCLVIHVTVSLEGDSTEDEGILFLFSTFFSSPPSHHCFARSTRISRVGRTVYLGEKSIRTLIHLFRMVI